ncbi:MAG TPA: glycosyltransferase family 9 protein [Rhodocyclaceae bacterium]
MIYFWLTWLFAPLLRLRAGRPAGAPRAVLLVQTAKIGDFVCTTPLVRELRRGWPHAELHLLIDGINEPLARHNPYAARVHLLPPGGLKGLSGRLWLWRLLRGCRIDGVVCASPSLPHWLVPLWAGVPLRASVVPNFGGGSYVRARRFLTHAEEHRAGRLLLETEFALLRRLGLAPGADAKEAWPAPGADGAAASLLGALAAPRIGVGVSAGNKLKELGEDKLVALARELLGRSAASVVLIGGPGDRELARRVRERLAAEGHGGRVLDASGRLGLAELPALLSRLDAYVGVDSGITYLADAVGVPVVDLMGPADADDQRPTGARAVVLRTDLPCAPCSHAFRAPYACAVGTRACVADASPQALAAHALGLLA